jgi:hypothetical protein
MSYSGPGRCFTSEGIREYGSRDYCLACNWDSGTSITERTVSAYDNTHKGEGGNEETQQSANFNFQVSNYSSSLQNALQAFSSFSNTVDNANIQNLHVSITKLSQATQPFIQSTLSMQKTLDSLKMESQKLNSLLKNDGDRIKKALERKLAQKKQPMTIFSQSMENSSNSNKQLSLDCTWKGFFNAGLERIYDDMLAQTAPAEVIEKNIIRGVLNMIKKDNQKLDAVDQEILEQIKSFTKGWIEHHRECTSQKKE